MLGICVMEYSEASPKGAYVVGSRTCGVPEYRTIGLAGGWDPWSMVIESYFAYQ